MKAKKYSELHTSGQISLKNVDLKPRKYKLEVKGLNGNFAFTKTDLSVHDFSCQVGRTDINANGRLGNVIPYFMYPNQSLSVDVKMKSDNLDLDQLFSSSTEESTGKYEFGLSDRLAFDVTADIKKLVFGKFRPKNIMGELVLGKQSLEGKNLKMDIANGKLYLDGTISQRKDSTFDANVKFKLEKMPIDSIFFMTDNFGQDFITHRHLKGEITSDVKAIFIFDKYLNIKPKSVIAEANMVIKNGQLINFGPMKSLSKFVDESALTNIKFSELKNTIQIAKSTVLIPEMEITTNITKMSVMGSHSFNNEFEYRVKLPLRNYKKKNNLEEQQAIEGNVFSGFYLYLLIKGTPDNFKVTYDKGALKQKIKERWQEEKKDFQELFKKDYQKKKLEKQKATEASDEEYFNF